MAIQPLSANNSRCLPRGFMVQSTAVPAMDPRRRWSLGADGNACFGRHDAVKARTDAVKIIVFRLEVSHVSIRQCQPPPAAPCLIGLPLQACENYCMCQCPPRSRCSRCSGETSELFFFIFALLAGGGLFILFWLSCVRPRNICFYYC